MQLCKCQLASGEVRVGIVAEEQVRCLDLGKNPNVKSLSDLLYSADPAQLANDLVDDRLAPKSLKDLKLLAPIDQQEVWAAGVTYKRSREARERESVGAAHFYDLVYSAARPELFFKATSHRVVGPGEPVRVRRDSRWSVPEPELALILSPQLKIVGFTIGNDMSARDIEGENPLYLPQAKVYDQCCALGPVITLASAMPPAERISIHLSIQRNQAKVFEGSTSIAAMARAFDDLVHWLSRDNSFPQGAVLLTGTGVVPPDNFALALGDLVSIEVTGIGRLENWVEQRA
jgi:2-dehydro-3-deoxy-D-arabinonate dehydratase